MLMKCERARDDWPQNHAYVGILLLLCAVDVLNERVAVNFFLCLSHSSIVHIFFRRAQKFQTKQTKEYNKKNVPSHV